MNVYRIYKSHMALIIIIKHLNQLLKNAILKHYYNNSFSYSQVQAINLLGALAYKS